MQDHLAKSGEKEKFPYKALTLLLSGYRPEIDVSSKLGESEASYFHSLVGVLWWIVELGRVDINVKVLMMSSHLALDVSRLERYRTNVLLARLTKVRC